MRDAEERDARDIAQIYNYAIEHSLAVFTETPSTVAERIEWLRARRGAGYPVFVCDLAGRVVGFASFSDFRPWPGYRFTVEHSVYVSQPHRGRGVGTLLMNKLFDAASALGKRTMVAGVEAGNTTSVRFHERLGFARAGTLPAVGFKFGTSVDLMFLYRSLTHGTATAT